MQQFANILQDGIPLEIVYEMTDEGVVIHEILHHGEDIYDFFAPWDETNYAFSGITKQVIFAWREEQLAIIAADRQGLAVRRESSRIELVAQRELSKIQFGVAA